MINSADYSQEVHGPYELHDIGNLDLEEGGTIRDCKVACAIGDDVRAQYKLTTEKFGLQSFALVSRRLNGRPADLRMGRTLSGYGEARRPHRWHGEKYHP